MAIAARKVYTWLLALLGLIILGTVLVLSTVKASGQSDCNDVPSI
jgi:hypothetical protein